MPESKNCDRLGEFLTQYDEYLDKKRAYSDLPALGGSTTTHAREHVEGNAMPDEEWKKQRDLSILTAFKTGRPVFSDTDGVLRYTDGAKELVNVEEVQRPVPRASDHAVRAERMSYRHFVLSLIATIVTAIWTIWSPWMSVFTVVFVYSAVIWSRVNQNHREALIRSAVLKGLE